jgi:hypothetical protein
MNGRVVLFSYIVCFAGAGLASCAVTSDVPIQDDVAELQSVLATLEQRKTHIEDINAIKRLQRSFGYYMDEALWDEVASLFAANGSIEMGLDGVYRGRNRVREYLYALGGGTAGLAPGQLNEHMQLMPVITIAPDGLSARGTWRDLILTGRMGAGAFWGEGPYENEYVKENGVWKISKLHWFQTLLVPYAGGWAKHQDVNRIFRHYFSRLCHLLPPRCFEKPENASRRPRSPLLSSNIAKIEHTGGPGDQKKSWLLKSFLLDLLTLLQQTRALGFKQRHSMLAMLAIVAMCLGPRIEGSFERALEREIAGAHA